MSEFPENTPDTGEEISEAESTVFSAPKEHKKTAPNKKKALWPKVLAAVLALAVLAGGTFAVIKLIPEKKEKTPAMPEMKTVTVLEENTNELKTVTVKNENGTFKLYSKAQEGDETANWYAEGYAEDQTQTDFLSERVEKAAKVTALEKEIALSWETCGLDDKTAVIVDVIKKDGSTYSIRIGNEAIDETGTYITLANKEEEKKPVFLASSLSRTDFVFSETDFLQTQAEEPTADKLPEIPANYLGEDGSIATFDKLTLSGAYFPETLVIEPNNDPAVSQFAEFITVSPTRRMAETEQTSAILGLFSGGVYASDTYSTDVSAAEQKKFGLDQPDLKAEIKLDKTTICYLFKKQADSAYAVMREGGKKIDKVTEDSISFIKYRLKDYYAKWVYLQSINELSGFTIKNKDASYAFSITYDSENEEEQYVITYNGKKLTAQNFQDFYQICISLSCIDFTVEKAQGEADLTIVYTYSDASRAPTTVDFKKVSETRYQYSIDGKPMGKVTATSLSPLMRYAAKVAEGGSIN